MEKLVANISPDWNLQLTTFSQWQVFMLELSEITMQTLDFTWDLFSVHHNYYKRY